MSEGNEILVMASVLTEQFNQAYSGYMNSTADFTGRIPNEWKHDLSLFQSVVTQVSVASATMKRVREQLKSIPLMTRMDYWECKPVAPGIRLKIEMAEQDEQVAVRSVVALMRAMLPPQAG